MGLDVGRCGREKEPRTESGRSRGHLAWVGHEEEAGGAARKVRRPRETTARVILKGGFFFYFTNGWDSQRSRSCAWGRRESLELVSTAMHSVVCGPAYSIA